MPSESSVILTALASQDSAVVKQVLASCDVQLQEHLALTFDSLIAATSNTSSNSSSNANGSEAGGKTSSVSKAEINKLKCLSPQSLLTLLNCANELSTLGSVEHHLDGSAYSALGYLAKSICIYVLDSEQRLNEIIDLLLADSLPRNDTLRCLSTLSLCLDGFEQKCASAATSNAGAHAYLSAAELRIKDKIESLLLDKSLTDFSFWPQLDSKRQNVLIAALDDEAQLSFAMSNRFSLLYLKYVVCAFEQAASDSHCHHARIEAHSCALKTPSHDDILSVVIGSFSLGDSAIHDHFIRADELAALPQFDSTSLIYGRNLAMVDSYLPGSIKYVDLDEFECIVGTYSSKLRSALKKLSSTAASYSDRYSAKRAYDTAQTAIYTLLTQCDDAILSAFGLSSVAISSLKNSPLAKLDLGNHAAAFCERLITDLMAKLEDAKGQQSAVTDGASESGACDSSSKIAKLSSGGDASLLRLSIADGRPDFALALLNSFMSSLQCKDVESLEDRIKNSLIIAPRMLWRALSEMLRLDFALASSEYQPLNLQRLEQRPLSNDLVSDVLQHLASSGQCRPAFLPDVIKTGMNTPRSLFYLPESSDYVASAARKCFDSLSRACYELLYDYTQRDIGDPSTSVLCCDLDEIASLESVSVDLMLKSAMYLVGYERELLEHSFHLQVLNPEFYLQSMAIVSPTLALKLSSLQGKFNVISGNLCSEVLKFITPQAAVLPSSDLAGKDTAPSGANDESDGATKAHESSVLNAHESRPSSAALAANGSARAAANGSNAYSDAKVSASIHAQSMVSDIEPPLDECEDLFASDVIDADNALVIQKLSSPSTNPCIAILKPHQSPTLNELLYIFGQQVFSVAIPDCHVLTTRPYADGAPNSLLVANERTKLNNAQSVKNSTQVGAFALQLHLVKSSDNSAKVDDSLCLVHHDKLTTVFKSAQLSTRDRYSERMKSYYLASQLKLLERLLHHLNNQHSSLATGAGTASAATTGTASAAGAGTASAATAGTAAIASVNAATAAAGNSSDAAAVAAMAAPSTANCAARAVYVIAYEDDVRLTQALCRALQLDVLVISLEAMLNEQCSLASVMGRGLVSAVPLVIDNVCLEEFKALEPLCEVLAASASTNAGATSSDERHDDARSKQSSSDGKSEASSATKVSSSGASDSVVLYPHLSALGAHLLRLKDSSNTVADGDESPAYGGPYYSGDSALSFMIEAVMALIKASAASLEHSLELYCIDANLTILSSLEDKRQRMDFIELPLYDSAEDRSSMLTLVKSFASDERGFDTGAALSKLELLSHAIGAQDDTGSANSAHGYGTLDSLAASPLASAASTTATPHSTMAGTAMSGLTKHVLCTDHNAVVVDKADGIEVHVEGMRGLNQAYGADAAPVPSAVVAPDAAGDANGAGDDGLRALHEAIPSLPGDEVEELRALQLNNIQGDQAIAQAMKVISRLFIDGHEWRSYQSDALPHILKRRNDYLISIPTGGGKSVLFQGPALYRSHYSHKLSIVICPLKALILDQILDLRAKGFTSADYLSSDRSRRDLQDSYANIISGKTQILYVTPERFRSRMFFKTICERLERDGGGEYIVFDESHCISQWGKEFRPDYLNAANICNLLRHIFPLSIIMCSATMTNQVAMELSTYLVNPLRLGDSEENYNPIREHIQIRMQMVNDDFSDRIDAIINLIRSENIDFNKSRMIIFCPTRRLCEQVCHALNESAYKIAAHMRKQRLAVAANAHRHGSAAAHALHHSSYRYSGISPLEQMVDHIDYYHAALSSHTRKSVFERFKTGCSHQSNQASSSFDFALSDDDIPLGQSELTKIAADKLISPTDYEQLYDSYYSTNAAVDGAAKIGGDGARDAGSVAASAASGTSEQDVVAAVMAEIGTALDKSVQFDEDEEDNQRQNKGPIYILCSTKAFGMGMDIPNIHYVVHFSPPAVFEDYLQEVGRAGRDMTMYREAFPSGRKIPAVCLYSPSDFEKASEKLNSQLISWNELINADRVLRHYIQQFRSLKDATTKAVMTPSDVLNRSMSKILLPSTKKLSSDDATRNRLIFSQLEEIGRIRMQFSGMCPMPVLIDYQKLKSLLSKIELRYNYPSKLASISSSSASDDAVLQGQSLPPQALNALQNGDKATRVAMVAKGPVSDLSRLAAQYLGLNEPSDEPYASDDNAPLLSSPLQDEPDVDGAALIISSHEHSKIASSSISSLYTLGCYLINLIDSEVDRAIHHSQQDKQDSLEDKSRTQLGLSAKSAAAPKDNSDRSAAQAQSASAYLAAQAKSYSAHLAAQAKSDADGAASAKSAAVSEAAARTKGLASDTNAKAPDVQPLREQYSEQLIDVNSFARDNDLSTNQAVNTLIELMGKEALTISAPISMDFKHSCLQEIKYFFGAEDFVQRTDERYIQSHLPSVNIAINVIRTVLRRAHSLYERSLGQDNEYFHYQHQRDDLNRFARAYYQNSDVQSALSSQLGPFDTVASDSENELHAQDHSYNAALATKLSELHRHGSGMHAEDNARDLGGTTAYQGINSAPRQPRSMVITRKKCLKLVYEVFKPLLSDCQVVEVKSTLDDPNDGAQGQTVIERMLFMPWFDKESPKSHLRVRTYLQALTRMVFRLLGQTASYLPNLVVRYDKQRYHDVSYAKELLLEVRSDAFELFLDVLSSDIIQIIELLHSRQLETTMSSRTVHNDLIASYRSGMALPLFAKGPDASAHTPSIASHARHSLSDATSTAIASDKAATNKSQSTAATGAGASAATTAVAAGAADQATSAVYTRAAEPSAASAIGSGGTNGRAIGSGGNDDNDGITSEFSKDNGERIEGMFEDYSWQDNWCSIMVNLGLMHDDVNELKDHYDLTNSRGKAHEYLHALNGRLYGYDYFKFVLDALSTLNFVSSSALLSFGIEVFTRDSSMMEMDSGQIESSEFYKSRCKFDLFEKFKRMRVNIMRLFCEQIPDRARNAFIESIFKSRNADDFIANIGKYSDKDSVIMQQLSARALELEELKIADNDEQWDIYNAPIDHNINVLAGPGSGKTHILTLRVARLIYHEHVAPESILVLAYNRAVVIELKNRLSTLFTALGLSGLGRRVKVFTFHGLAKRCLQDKLQHVEASNWEHTFSDRLTTEPQLFTALFPRLEYIMIDEFQDITATRLELLNVICSQYADLRLFTIGDINQSIYGFDRISPSTTYSAPPTLRQAHFRDLGGSSVMPRWPHGSSIVPKERQGMANVNAQHSNGTECNGRQFQSKRPELLSVEAYAAKLSPEPYYTYLNQRFKPVTMYLSRNYRSYQKILQTAAGFLSDKTFLPYTDPSIERFAPEHSYARIFDLQIDRSHIWYQDLPRIIAFARKQNSDAASLIKQGQKLLARPDPKLNSQSQNPTALTAHTSLAHNEHGAIVLGVDDSASSTKELLSSNAALTGIDQLAISDEIMDEYKRKGIEALSRLINDDFDDEIPELSPVAKTISSLESQDDSALRKSIERSNKGVDINKVVNEVHSQDEMRTKALDLIKAGERKVIKTIALMFRTNHEVYRGLSKIKDSLPSDVQLRIQGTNPLPWFREREFFEIGHYIYRNRDRRVIASYNEPHNDSTIYSLVSASLLNQNQQSIATNATGQGDASDGSSVAADSGSGDNSVAATSGVNAAAKRGRDLIVAGKALATQDEIKGLCLDLMKSYPQWDKVLIDIAYCVVLSFLETLADAEGEVRFEHLYEHYIEMLGSDDGGQIFKLYERYRNERLIKDERINIILTTMHKVKGLEFDLVMVIPSLAPLPISEHFNVDNPYGYHRSNYVDIELAAQAARNIPLAADELADLAEEKRLYYVAYTRARKYLYAYQADREKALKNNQRYLYMQEQALMFSEKSPSLDNYFISFTASDRNFATNNYIRQCVRCNDSVTLHMLPKSAPSTYQVASGTYTEQYVCNILHKKDDNSQPVIIGRLAQKNPLFIAMQKQQVSTIEGLFISNIATWSYEDTLEADKRKAQEAFDSGLNAPFAFSKLWGEKAKSAGYIYVIMLAGFGRPS